MKFRKRPGVFALAAVSAALAVVGAGAGTAGATTLPVCTGGNIHGEGSSLQNAAQTIWTARGSGTGFNGNTTWGCTAVGAPRATYTKTSSGQCLAAWGSAGGALNTAINFCGTDDAPTTGQITNINTATRSSVVSVAVAQAAIAIVVNPPAGCTINSITPADLEGVFRGSITTWAGITGTSGCGTNTITRVVRADSSGTSYQLKHYLNNQNSANVYPCSTSSPTTTWAGLQDPTLNTAWPCSSTGLISSRTGCGATSCTGAAGSGSGGGDEVKSVGVTAGSIGYAALADARSVYAAGTYASLKWIPLRVGASLLDPSSNRLSTTLANSNCTTAARSYASGTFPALTASWSGVYLTNAGTGYPLCTLTWDTGVTDYTRAWSASVRTTVCDYFNYILQGTGGQRDALSSANDYQIIPSDVQTAAQAAVLAPSNLMAC